MHNPTILTGCLFVLGVTILVVYDRSLFNPLLQILRDGLGHYMKALNSRPLFTKSCTAFVLFSVSDLNAQLIENRGSKPSFLRVLRFAIWGSMVGAPLLHTWYLFLANFFTRYISLDKWIQAFTMSAVDQTCFFPLYAAFYFLYAELTTGGTYTAAYVRCRTELRPLVARASIFWVPANTGVWVVYMSCAVVLFRLFEFLYV